MTDGSRQVLWSEFRLLLVVAAVAAAAAVLILASGVFLMGFAGILMAIVLRGPSVWIARHTPLSTPWALALVLVTLASLFALLGWYSAPRVAAQAAAFAERLPQAVTAFEQLIAARLGRDTPPDVGSALPEFERLLGMVPNIATATFGALGSLLLVLVLGIYLAATPEAYRDGAIRLFRRHRRAGVADMLDRMGEMLTRWMRAQALSMLIVGVLSYVALSLLGVPLALSLSLITGLLEFVPYLGALVAAVPVVLVASTESWTLALYALAAYTVIQSVEGNLVIPLLQGEAIRIPPAAILLIQVLMGVLFGVIGIVLATPLAAAGAVLVRRGYIDQVLERD